MLACCIKALHDEYLLLFIRPRGPFTVFVFNSSRFLSLFFFFPFTSPFVQLSVLYVSALDLPSTFNITSSGLETRDEPLWGFVSFHVSPLLIKASTALLNSVFVSSLASVRGK